MSLATEIFVVRQDLQPFCACWQNWSAKSRQAYLTWLRKLGGDRDQFERDLAELCLCCGVAQSTEPGGQPQPQPNPGGGGGTPEPKPDQPAPEPGKPTPDPKKPSDALADCIQRMVKKMCTLGPENLRTIATVWKQVATLMEDGLIKTLILQGAAAINRVAELCDTGGTVFASDVRGFCIAYDALQQLQASGELALLISSTEIVEQFVTNLTECCSFPEAKGGDLPPWMVPFMKDKVALRPTTVTYQASRAR